MKLQNWIQAEQTSEGQRRYVALDRVATDFPELRRSARIVHILAENLIRKGNDNCEEQLKRLLSGEGDVPFWPDRVVMQDVAGSPALMDIASLRDSCLELGQDPKRIDLGCQLDLVVDHSIRNDFTGPGSADRNLDAEYRDNAERFIFLRWAENEFSRFRVIPPGNGIIHQVNLERMSSPIASDGQWIFPETLVGTDSHTTMINGLGILGWGVGGIEASAVLMGQPIPVPPPEVIGIRLSGRPGPGIFATDVALRLAEKLRRENVTGAYIEFFGSSVANLSVPDRATISNMTPEYGATCSLFPMDGRAITYLEETGRTGCADRARSYMRLQPMLCGESEDRNYHRIIDIDLGEIKATVSGPRLPHQSLDIDRVAATVAEPEKSGSLLRNGDIVIASITSCTNTSNPAAMIAAGLIARNAVARNLTVSPHIKTSLSPGSRSVVTYLNQLELLEPLEKLGFWVSGFGCMTCVGNSGELPAELAGEIARHSLDVSAVLSGNRNYEGRIHPLVRSAYLASPPFVVAYALAGTMTCDLTRDPIGSFDGDPVYLDQIWPSPAEIEHCLRQIDADSYSSRSGEETRWDSIAAPAGACYPWSDGSTYIVRPNIESDTPKDVVLRSARPLLVLGDSVTTDHISPVGRIAEDSPAGIYLKQLGVDRTHFNTYGSRRGNAAVMRLGTFANAQLRNVLLEDKKGWFTRLLPDGDVVTIPEAADHYARSQTDLVIVAGDAYGSGSARDWAAKGTRALGVRAVLARSFERIHRSNLALVGVMPIEWNCVFDLDGTETFDILTSPEEVSAGAILPLHLKRRNQSIGVFEAKCRLDTSYEVDCWRMGGVLARALNRVSG